MRPQRLEPGGVIAVDVARWDRFADELVLRRLAGDLWDPEFEGSVTMELSQRKHGFCSFKVIDAQRRVGARVSIARVADRWWTLMQHGSKLELYGVDRPIELPTPVYELLEPIWGTLVLLPWASSVDKDSAIATAKSVLVGGDVPSVTFPQMPIELGMGLLERHQKSPLDPQDFDLASSDFARINPV